MRFRFKQWVIAAAVALLASGAQAAVIPWTATLTGDQEVPPVETDATGSASGTVDTVTGELTWSLQWSGIETGVAAIHFHVGAPGEAPPGNIVLHLFNINPPVFPLLGGEGMITNPPNVSISPDQVDELLAGLWYLNIHSPAHPTGEIRGQVIAAVPEPGTIGLLGAGLLGLALIRRRIAR